MYLEELLAIAARIETAPHPGTGARASASASASAKTTAEEVYGGATAVWRQLSKLYGALGDNDVLLGLAEKVGATCFLPITFPPSTLLPLSL